MAFSREYEFSINIQYSEAALSPSWNQIMNLPEWTKPGLYGALSGAIIVSIGEFTVGGWVTGSSAAKMSKAMAYSEVTDALVPVCLDSAAADPARVEQFAAIQEAPSYNRPNVVMDAGWATPPGTETPNRDLAKACLAGLDLDAS